MEFHNKNGVYIPFPVEYKRGKQKPDNCDKIQLCAQALCLEEMLGLKIEDGAIFYGKTKRRLAVKFTKELCAETKNTIGILHKFIKAQVTPKPEYNKKCDSCSFSSLCLPKTLEKANSVKRYLQKELENL